MIVKTAEEACSPELAEVQRVAQQFIDEHPDTPKLSAENAKRSVDGLVSGTVSGVRSAAYAKVLDTRSKKTPLGSPQEPRRIP